MLLTLSILAAIAIAYLLWQWRTGDLAKDPPANLPRDRAADPRAARLRTAPTPSLRRVTPQRLNCAGTMTTPHRTRDTVANR